jgi:transposase
MPEVAERIGMSQRERDRLVVLRSVIDDGRRQVEAARHLGLSTRQVRRLQRRLKDHGDRAVVHKLRGRPSNNARDAALRQRVLLLYRSDYGGDYGPTLLAEKLLEQHGIVLSAETLRLWLLAAGLWQRKRKRDTRRRRARRACFGELLQADGSHHDWLEGRGEGQIVLLAMIDDATSRVLARFYEAETTEAYFDLLGRYIRRHGRPLALYSDRIGIFRTEPAKRPTERDYQPQAARALEELNVRLIMARSPQAKGRVERLFNTAQDRWVKELREARAATIEQANAVLDAKLLPQFNRRFTVKPSAAADAHLPSPPAAELAGILCEQHERTVGNDYTVRFENRVLQIPPPALPGLRGGKVTVEKRAGGEVRLRFKAQYLRYEVLASPPPPPPPRPAAAAGHFNIAGVADSSTLV